MARRFRWSPLLGAMALLTVVGAVLRYWGIQHGLPHPGSRPDERELLEHTGSFAAGDWNPRWFIYPTFYFHLTWLWDEALLAIWRLWRPRPSYSELVQTNLAPLLLTGRMLTAAFGTLMIPIAYAIGRRMQSGALGLIAATLIAGNYLLVRDAHALKPDVHLALGVLVSVWLLARYATAPTLRNALLAGVAIGLTTALKYNGILLLIPAYVADLMTPRRTQRALVPSRLVIVLGITAVASFLAACPFLVTDFARTYETYLIATRNVYVTRPESVAPPDADWLTRAWIFLRTRSFGYHLTLSLRYGCGLAIALLTLPALLFTLRRGSHPMSKLAAVFCVVYYLVAGASPVMLARYFTPIVPLVLLLVAELLLAVVAPLPQAVRGLAAAVATAALLAEPLYAAIAFDRIAAQTDTRVLATEWMTQLPSGSVVAVVGTGPFAMTEPVFPVMVVRRIALPADGETFRSLGITHVMTVWHHDLGFFSQGSIEQLGSHASELKLAVEMSPFAGPPAGAFEREDAYYIPFHHFSGVVRPGPLLRIYSVQ